MSVRDGLLAEYDHEIATTRKLLERIPDDRLTWKPHTKSRALGELATHISSLPEWGLTILSSTSFDLNDVPPGSPALSSRAEILAQFDAVTARTRAAMDKTDPEYVTMWTLKRGGHEMFSMPRVASFRSFVLSHLIHHRGQLSVYLRLNDVPVPAIYGPSADEG